MKHRIEQLEQALRKALNLLADHGIDTDLPDDIAELWTIYNGEDSFYTEARLNAFRVAKKALLKYKPSMKG